MDYFFYITIFLNLNNILISTFHKIRVPKQVELMKKSNAAKNGDARIITDSDKFRHLEFFMNGSWRHDPKCKQSVNKECNKVRELKN